jgi:phage tail sheath protein FI
MVILAKDGTLNEQPSSVTFSGPDDDADTVTAAIQINTRQYALGTAGTSAFSTGGLDGNDGGMPDFAEYVGNPVTQTGFHALDPVDLFNLMVLPADLEMPDTTRQQIWGPASIYCQSRRAFLLVDPPAVWTSSDGRPDIVQSSSQVNDLRATVVKDHAAVFFPRVRYNDRGIVKAVGPTGVIAGLMARTDASRGVWKAPAGTEADLRGIAGLEVKLTDLENGVLNKLAVNCLRSFPSGFVNWGARTLDGSDDIGSEWKYIPIRRLALFIEESLFRGTQWVVFEPNDEPLWARIRLNVGVFMSGLFRQGAFQGSTPDQAYYVKCDGETTTQADRNLGIVNIEVGFAPLKPAEFVVITIQQIAGDLS